MLAKLERCLAYVASVTSSLPEIDGVIYHNHEAMKTKQIIIGPETVRCIARTH